MRKFTKHALAIMLMGLSTCTFAQQDVTITETIQKQSKQELLIDPCKVFIGVSTTSCGCDEGVRVVRVVSGTPAEKAGLKAGDIITALDGVLVFSSTDLRLERDKHEQGDKFEIAYIRDEVAQNVVAQFKNCETEATRVAPNMPIDYTLDVSDLKVFPNPTYGKLTIQFEAEAVPTVLTITDVTGKLIYVDQRPRFEGFYQNEINISKEATPGIMNIMIQQGNKVKAEKAILLPGA